MKELNKKIEELEKQLAELKEQIENSNNNTSRVKSYEDLNNVKGFYIQNNSTIYEIGICRINNNQKNIFKTKAQAKSALAYAQLTQLMANYNGDWQPDWNNDNEIKYCIERCYDNIQVNTNWRIYYFLSFPTEKLAKEFLKNFKEIIEQYYMI